jgi:hypothetical protein
MIRTLAIAAGAGALVLSAAAPAMAADISTFPAKASLYTNPTPAQKLSITAMPAPTCTLAQLDADGKPITTGYFVRVVGQKGAVKVEKLGDACEWTVTALKKGNAVVKFVNVTSLDPAVEDGRTVQSLVVKVNKTQGKPANTGKPAKP